jgi:predicted transposase YdaD
VRDEDLPAVIRTMAERIDREASPEVAAEIWTSTFVLMGLRYRVDQIAALLRGILDMKESVTFQAILDEGRKEGREEGKLQEARDLLIRVGRKRLSSPSASIAKRIKRINDRLRLEELLVRLNDVESWNELLAAPPSANGGK